MTLRAMQAAPPADGSHEPAWDKLIPSEYESEVRHTVSLADIFGRRPGLCQASYLGT